MADRHRHRPRHRHGRGSGDRGSERRTARWLGAVAVLLAVGTVAGMVVLWPGGDAGEDVLGELGFVREVEEARVLDVGTGPCRGTDEADAVTCLQVDLLLLTGPDAGDGFRLEFPDQASSPRLEPGEVVVLARQDGAPPEFAYAFVDRQRKAPLFWLALLFALAVVALGRLRGVAALAGLGASFLVLLQFVLPALLEGRDPLLVATVGASAIAFLALYLAHGFRAMTTVALLGTVCALVLTAVLGTLFVELARFTGFASEEAILVTIGASEVDLAGLILAGLVIGALGAIDDMTVTQASAVWELRAAHPGMPTSALVRAGMRIGRDHVASTVNTLFLAYAGASLPLLLLFVLSRQSLGTVANGEVVATEIVRTLVGSIGLVAAVPVTTWLAAASVPPGPPSDDEVEGAAPREDLGIPERRRDAWF